MFVLRYELIETGVVEYMEADLVWLTQILIWDTDKKCDGMGKGRWFAIICKKGVRK